ncbi:hypothetical protein BD414DRAFT_582144 [Trametes punicea]|nr:hypothetical protein BD414DRAFT_582144 [Trametes punicea]
MDEFLLVIAPPVLEPEDSGADIPVDEDHKYNFSLVCTIA